MNKKTIKELNSDILNNKITIEALRETTLNDLKKVDSKLHAINSYVDGNTAFKTDSLLYGIPYVMKDLVSTKDIKTTSSSAILENYFPPFDATIYRLLSEAGSIMVAKSNLDQFGIGGTNENTVSDYARNPYNTSFTAGGSSGGSAAVVAAGCVPFSIGSDTGDSVRKPAGYCGIYGYKPTWSIISRYGVFAYASSLDQIGIFSRCIDDIAIVLETINGFDKMDSTSTIHKKENYYKKLVSNNKPLKVGYIKELIDCFDNELVIKQFNETLEYIKSLNHDVVELNMDLELLRSIRGTYQIIVNAEGSSNLGDLSGIHFGKQVLKDDVKNSIIATRSQGLTKFTKARNLIGAIALKDENKEDYLIKAKKVRQVMINESKKLFDQVDIIIAPCSNTNSFNPRDIEKNDNIDVNLVAENHLSFTNLIGACGLTIPTHLDNDLPYAMSFMARPYDDQLLLNFGKQFEEGLLENNYLNLQSFYNRYKEVE